MKRLILLLAVLAVPVGAQEPSPAAPFDRAVEAVEANDLETAIALLSGLGPSAEPRARALLGALYVETGRGGAALEALAPLAQAPDANPAVLYNAGRAAAQVARHDEAIAYFERSVAAQPDSPAARELGIYRARNREYDEAYALLKPWARSHPEDREARTLAALAAVQLRRPNEAEGFLSDLPQDEPGVRLLWGRVLLLKADPWGALATLKPLLEEQDTESPGLAALLPDVRRLIAEAHAAVGEAAKAVKILENHVGNNPSVGLQLAQAQYQSGDLDAALQTLEPFATRLGRRIAAGDAIAPGVELNLIVEYGRLLATSGRHQDALPFLQEATRLDPENKQSWQQLGQALAAVGRRDEAKKALEKFQQIVTTEVPTSLEDVQLEKDFEDPTGRELREAMKELAQNRPDRALEIARREQKLAPEDLRPYLVEANILLLSGKIGEALEAADRIVQGAPWSADAHYLRGTALIAAEETEAAERDLRKALELSPDHTAAMNDLAVILLERGEEDEARSLLARALELRPDDALARANLERLGG